MQSQFDATLMRRMRGLFRLAEAAADAEASEVDDWQYAITVDELRRHCGLDSDIQWLITEEFADCRLETTRPGMRRRAFRQAGVIDGNIAKAALVLSDKGITYLRHVLRHLENSGGPRLSKPNWDASTGRWELGGVLVKQLGESAVAQRAVLDKCEACSWCELVESPFIEMPPRKRSHYLGQVLNHLNKCQIATLIHFSSTDKGRRLRWSLSAKPVR